MRAQLSSLRGLLLLSTLMTSVGDTPQIVRLATGAVPAIGHCEVAVVVVDDALEWGSVPDAVADGLRAELAARDPNSEGGATIAVPGVRWAWAYPTRSNGLRSGWMVITASEAPNEQEQFLLRVLAQQTGVALANARLHARERATAGELVEANQSLQRTIEIHDRLTTVAWAAEEGQEGIVRALHELTGRPVLTVDRHGNVLASAGAHSAVPPASHSDALRPSPGWPTGRPVRDRDYVVAVARPADELVGVIALFDPDVQAGVPEFIALEYAATVLSSQLVRAQRQSDSDRERERRLVELLIEDGDHDVALALAQAIGYDVGRRQRVLVVEGSTRDGDHYHFARVVGQTARALEIGVGVPHGEVVVVLAVREPPWRQFRAAVLDGLGCDGQCRVGVGGVSEAPEQIRRSFDEARLALRVRSALVDGPDVIAFDDLGVYQVLGASDDLGVVDRLVDRWLGALLAHDGRRGTQLVTTLDAYLECGGNYDATAAALAVHRSTLKARLARLRDIGNHDLSDPDTRFHLQLACRASRVRATLEANDGPTVPPA